jgi:hypothetical protein
MKYLFLVFSLLGLLYATDGSFVPSAQRAQAARKARATATTKQTSSLQSPIYTATTDGTPIPR